ncbi:unnamed protein product [Mytilus coruscus]|uniref:Uncharacterized protein n=1 Tax=Mytilus coruscus TaxID=42192 RepID=A0A6J8DP36_MYTCO|nr:unnamed protein product [Mytilus coruscus]
MSAVDNQLKPAIQSLKTEIMDNLDTKQQQLNKLQEMQLENKELGITNKVAQEKILDTQDKMMEMLQSIIQKQKSTPQQLNIVTHDDLKTLRTEIKEISQTAQLKTSDNFSKQFKKEGTEWKTDIARQLNEHKEQLMQSTSDNIQQLQDTIILQIKKDLAKINDNYITLEGTVNTLTNKQSNDRDQSKSSSSESSRSRSRSPQVPKMTIFDGIKSTSWESFIYQFDRTANRRKWSNRKKISRLLDCLKDTALEYARKVNKDDDYDSLKKKIEKKI